MYLVKDDNYFVPYDTSDKIKFNKLKEGTVVKASQARNVEHHKKAFAILNTGFENQEKYADFDAYRMVTTIKAGYYIEVESKRGKEYLPKSLSFENMSQADFEEFYESMCTVIAGDLGITTDELKENI